MSGITTHVLDTSRGKPASGVLVTLERRSSDGSWIPVGHGETDADGRLKSLAPDSIEAGVYRLTFDTATYFRERHAETFYPEVIIVFSVHDTEQHYHVPLLLAPWGYSTYRGS
ncbi:MAG TPA: hydroxyisourate hydrolase [Thermoanaerobaculia bacterium]|nr:hydroxyisourate hydrolase [Thermoanaerobaculia bacterium]